MGNWHLRREGRIGLLPDRISNAQGPDVKRCYLQGRIACIVIGAVRASRLRKLSFTKKKSQNTIKNANWVCGSFPSSFVFIFLFRNMAHTSLVFLKRAALKK